MRRKPLAPSPPSRAIACSSSNRSRPHTPTERLPSHVVTWKYRFHCPELQRYAQKVATTPTKRPKIFYWSRISQFPACNFACFEYVQTCLLLRGHMHWHYVFIAGFHQEINMNILLLRPIEHFFHHGRARYSNWFSLIFPA